MIGLRDAARRFEVGGQQVSALDGVNLSVDAGEYVAIMGPSGSGKSTLLNVIGLLDRLSAGSYVLDDHDVTGLSDQALASTRLAKIGFIFQFFHLVPRLTALQNVELPLTLAGCLPVERRERAALALEGLGLSERLDHRPDQLSGGQRQRVAIARATIMRPPLVLADEPTGNLDRRSGQEVIRILESLHESGITLLMVTHDHQLGRRARRRVVLEDGRITEDTGPGR